ncbi:MAG: 23S rRNA (uracil(747)-C(5))-methyltransferase RlmC [Pseudomarimonas sp.]
MTVHCSYFEAQRCRSCSDIEQPYNDQLLRKQADLKKHLDGWPDLHWLPPVASAETGFRSKAKMAVGGSIESPTLGLVDAAGRAEDLAACLLYPATISTAFAPIKHFISAARIAPYDIVGRRGELKFVLLTVAEHSGELMLRFVLRSREALGRIQATLPRLRESLPLLRVVSVNLQPLPAAIVEGDEEIALSEQQHLRIELNGLPFFLRPRGFFQTNQTVAAALYRQARDWVVACAPTRVWDLFCGVGGFAAHCADGSREVHGVELSEEAIEGARLGAEERRLPRLTFEILDAAAQLRFPGRGCPDLVIVNPPRRGIGEALAHALEHSAVEWLIYSSCNPSTLATDLRRMPAFRPQQARLLDMFPHTSHSETLVLLRRQRNPPIQHPAG